MAKSKAKIQNLKKITSTVKKLKTVYVSWEHNDKCKNTYATVRAECGHGCSKMQFRLESTRDEVLKYCIKHVWT